MLCYAIGIKPLLKICKQYKEVGDYIMKFSRFILTQVIGCIKDTR
jgi:hypothetical protein